MSLDRTFEAKTRSVPFTPRTKIAPPKARTFSPLRHARVAASPSPNNTLTLARGLSTRGLSQNGYSLSLSRSLSCCVSCETPLRPCTPDCQAKLKTSHNFIPSPGQIQAARPEPTAHEPTTLNPKP